MLNRVANERLIKALVVLRSHSEFQAVMAWLKESRESLCKDMVVQRDEVTLRQQQGALQALDDLLAAVEQSVTLLPK